MNSYELPWIPIYSISHWYLFKSHWYPVNFHCNSQIFMDKATFFFPGTVQLWTRLCPGLRSSAALHLSPQRELSPENMVSLMGKKVKALTFWNLFQPSTFCICLSHYFSGTKLIYPCQPPNATYCSGIKWRHKINQRHESEQVYRDLLWT